MDGIQLLSPRKMACLVWRALLLLILQGCGAASLIHDGYVGPISPAGRLHPIMNGADYRTESNLKRGLLHPFPAGLFDGAPSTAGVTRWVTRTAASFSFVIAERHTKGKELSREALGSLAGATDVLDVLDICGPPRQWIKRKGGSLMLYGAELSKGFAFFVGIPPGLSYLVPIPGLSSLSFRFQNARDVGARAAFFFDADDRLLGISTLSVDPG